MSLLFLAPSAAHAYLDPGTGSIILQGLIAGIAGLMVTAGLYWQRFKAFFRRKKGRQDDAGSAAGEGTPGDEKKSH